MLSLNGKDKCKAMRTSKELHQQRKGQRSENQTAKMISKTDIFSIKHLSRIITKMTEL